MAAEFTTYNPIRSVARVAAPVLLVAATNDSLCPYELVERAAELNPKACSSLPPGLCPAEVEPSSRAPGPGKVLHMPRIG